LAAAANTRMHKTPFHAVPQQRETMRWREREEMIPIYQLNRKALRGFTGAAVIQFICQLTSSALEMLRALCIIQPRTACNILFPLCSSRFTCQMTPPIQGSYALYPPRKPFGRRKSEHAEEANSH
jgi:hypothetical protein